VASWCQYIPKAAQGYVPECASAELETTSPELSEAPWCHFITNPATLKLLPECHSAATSETLEATRLTAASWCQYIPAAAKQYVPECASADLEATGPELSVAPWCRFITNPNTIRLLPECHSAATSETLESTRLPAFSWCPQIPKAARKYVPECRIPELESTGSELSVASWCQYIPKAAIVYVPECASAVSDELKAPAKFE